MDVVAKTRFPNVQNEQVSIAENVSEWRTGIKLLIEINFLKNNRFSKLLERPQSIKNNSKEKLKCKLKVDFLAGSEQTGLRT